MAKKAQGFIRVALIFVLCSLIVVIVNVYASLLSSLDNGPAYVSLNDLFVLVSLIAFSIPGFIFVKKRLFFAMAFVTLYLSAGFLLKYFAMEYLNTKAGGTNGVVNNLDFYYGYILIVFGALSALLIVTEFVRVKIVRIVGSIVSLAACTATVVIQLLVLISNISFLNVGYDWPVGSGALAVFNGVLYIVFELIITLFIVAASLMLVLKTTSPSPKEEGLCTQNE